MMKFTIPNICQYWSKIISQYFFYNLFSKIYVLTSWSKINHLYCNGCRAMIPLAILPLSRTINLLVCLLLLVNWSISSKQGSWHLLSMLNLRLIRFSREWALSFYPGKKDRKRKDLLNSRELRLESKGCKLRSTKIQGKHIQSTVSNILYNNKV